LPGKRYEIFKRQASENATWYFRFQQQGKRRLVCARTNNKSAAIRFFQKTLAAAWNGRLAELEKEKEQVENEAACESVETLIKCYRAMPTEASEKTQRTNANCLALAARRVFGENADLSQISSAHLNVEFVQRYFEQALRHAREHRDQTTQQRIKRSANSIFNQALSVVRPKVVAAMRRNGYSTPEGIVKLQLPDFEALRQAYKEEKFNRVGSGAYVPPKDQIIKSTFEGWLSLPRNEFLAVGLELCFGLRAGEIAQAKWNWLNHEVDGQPVLMGGAAVKSGGGFLHVRALNPFWSLFCERVACEQWAGQPDDFILSGSETERCETVFRNVSSWMRALGWDTQKTNHALRAYAGSQVAMRYGIYHACLWLRHSSVKVTEQHYSYFVEAHKVESPDKVQALGQPICLANGK
jgi:hypothetical protein